VDSIPLLAQRSATVVVLPEKVFAVETSDLATRLEPLVRLASTYRVTIVIGLALRGPGGSANVALAVTGSEIVRYDKHHLIPGIESDFIPGTGLSYVDGYGLTVCKDMDFPALMRGLGGTGLVLAPAWDFGSDGWWHSRMAVLRGVEDGFSVARTARNGSLTASDANGRVRAEASGPGLVMVVADLPTTPVTTVYERWTDWFAWLCLAAVAALVALRVARRVKLRRTQGE
jgi:apolipoprotein N-acyltransferase